MLKRALLVAGAAVAVALAGTGCRHKCCSSSSYAPAPPPVVANACDTCR